MSTKNTNRDLGLDLLRIVSMLMVITIHYCGNGGLFSTLQPWSTNWFMATWINTSCIVCVNLFVMISGYFLCTASFQLKKWISVWATTVFYSVGIYLALSLAGLLPFSVAETIKHCMPFTLEQYWFVTPYLLMYAAMPIMNAAIRALSQKQHLICCGVLLLFFCVLPNVVYINDFTDGNSLPWFLTLYLVAAYIRKYVKPDSIQRRKAFGVFLACIAVIMVQICLAHWLTPKIFGKVMLTSLFLYRSSIPLAIASIALFEVFRGTKIRSKVFSKLIGLAAPAAFSAYLISHHPQLKVFVWELLSPSDYANSPWLIFHMPLCILGIFAVCCLIDYIRQWMFRHFRINSLIQKIGDFVTNTVESNLKKFLP